MTRWRRFFQWMKAARLFGFTAIIIGSGLAIWPQSYSNPSYRVLFTYIGPRQAGLVWIAVGLVAVTFLADWATVLISTAMIGWGLGLGAAALISADGQPHAGSPLGWLWFVAFGLAMLRTLVILGPDRMRT